jgi:hypothetical protein
MRDIKQEIIDKSLSFRDASLALARNQSKFFKGKDLDNLGDPKEFAKFMDKDADFKKSQEKSQQLISELFALLDELDVIEGRGIQR